MKIGLVGWGVETKSAYHYYGDEHEYVIGNEEPREDFPVGANITIYSHKEKRAPGLVGNVTDLSYLDHYDGCELILYQGATRKNLEKKFLPDDSFWQIAKTPLEIFFEKSPTKNIIGITGTKGKGTTSTLIAKMLEAADKKVFLGGNIGRSPLDFLNELSPEDWIVLELSSFQLYKLPYSPHIAVHLMLMPEHIDEWHLSMEDYVEAKRNIFSHQTHDDIAVYLPTNEYSSDNSTYSKGKRIPYTESPGARVDSDGFISIGGVQIIHKSSIKLLGAHNLQNICAAVTAVWQVHQDQGAFRSVLTSFSGLEHRLELAGEVDGVKYYDDSFGTTPDTTLVALDAFETSKVLIVGGYDKGNPFESLAARLTKGDLSHIIFIGTTGKKIYDLSVAAGLDVSKASIRDDGNSWTMTEIVKTARKSAKLGDIVLLSTGCASFGLFRDYKDRGEQFKQAVQKLN